MRHRFLYFLPGVGGCSEQMLLKLGLYDRFIGPNGTLGGWVRRACDSGPGGKGGCLISGGQRPPDFFADARQTWVESARPDGTVVWIGIENAQTPPGPDDLILPTNIQGPFVTLGDGNLWRVPMVKRWDGEAFEHVLSLPQKIAVRIEGGKRRITHEVIPAFQPLLAIGERVWDSFLNGTPMPLDGVFEDAVTLLAANYRLGAEEVSLLGLLDPESAQEVLRAAVDIRALQEQAHEMAGSNLMDCEQKPDVDAMDPKGEVGGG